MAPKLQSNKRQSVSKPTGRVSSPPIDYAEAQIDEINALKAIYMEDFEELEAKAAWNKTTERRFKLTLRPLSDYESFVILSVTFTATYPRSAPLITVDGLQYFHERTQSRINSIIQNRIKQMQGEVVIHSIGSDIQDALEDAVAARQQGTLPSLLEERASAEETAIAEAKKLEEAEAKRQREASEREEESLRQKADAELNRRDKTMTRRYSTTGKPQHPHSRPHISFDQDAYVQIDNECVKFDTVVLLSTLDKKPNEELFLGQVRAEKSTNRPLVAIRKVTVNKARSDIMAIETALEAVSKIRHPNVLALHAYRVNKLDAELSCIILCSQFANCGTLHSMLQLASFHVDKARQFIIELLEALEFLHRNGLPHGLLSASSIYLSHSSAVSPKLGRMGQWLLDSSNIPVPSKWQAPEAEATSPQQRIKADIWNLGVVAVQMLLGLQVLDEHQGPYDLLSRLRVSSAFDDFARKIFTIDSKKRPSAFELLPVEFLRTDAIVTSQLASFGARRASSAQSRYATDFTELGLLGEGGFGQVVKARHRLDGGTYAVKKIKHASQLSGQVLSEARLLMRPNHLNVVRYYSTWVEDDSTEAAADDESSGTSSTTSPTPEATRSFSSASSSYPSHDHVSRGGLDFVSSESLGQIEFGYDDEGASNADSGDEGDRTASNDVTTSTDNALNANDRPVQSPRLKSILYIVMEFCGGLTLRKLIKNGMSVNESWQYMRLITKGLDHIHSHQIIHRDLKPDNVFIDHAGNPKIGDFGLATTAQVYPANRVASGSYASGSYKRSGGVGTPLYTAPELCLGSSTACTDKVDMYSLGIMFFEMCERFETYMERVMALQKLRNNNFVLPESYRPGGDKAAQGRLIARLIAHNPTDRPSSTELLQSDMMPVELEDEAVRQVLSTISDPQSPYHRKMMTGLFTQDPSLPSRRVKELAWDSKVSVSPESLERLQLRSTALQMLEQIFRRHGAEEMRRESVFPRSDYNTDKRVFQLLDNSGNLLQLPYDLILPSARQAARNTPPVKRAFVFGTAFRDAHNGGPPTTHEEVDFDIYLCSDDDQPAIDDAELLKVMDEVVDAIPGPTASSSMYLHINHTLILDAILEFCRVPAAKQFTVKEILSRLGFLQYTWAKLRVELRKSGLPDTTLDDLGMFDFHDAPAKGFDHARELLRGVNPQLKEKFERGVRALEDILSLVGHMELRQMVYFMPLASVNAKFYDGGMLVQSIMERNSTRVVIAAGGRYDSLVKAHRVGNSQSDCKGAVGVAIGLDNVVARMVKGKSTKDKKMIEDQPVRPYVLVETSGGEDTQAVAIKIIISLWAHEIRAQLGTGKRHDDGHNFLVIVRHASSQTVRLTNLMTGAEEQDVPVAMLTNHILQETRDLNSSKGRQSAPPHRPGNADTDRKTNVQVLMSQHRSKKVNKYNIVAEAQKRWEKVLEAWKGVPILAVETRDEVLDAIRETRLSEPESWRKVAQSVPPNERQYLQQIQDLLLAWRAKWANAGGEREGCLFNFLTGHCIYYDFGR
ncbi:Serine/threonine-protein kinase [Piedraia hortae CBS 480.64]|uniref:non-specific serine/threonine protein kinase n=1 Tax=Piedraia hortae CBS 480.64 TaxID=1314780 RepID=A0A6A7C2M8_9PEZI|nr:Serine/threonine-protein kinase [Piedraia hortae CBS 480.64]